MCVLKIVIIQLQFAFQSHSRCVLAHVATLSTFQPEHKHSAQISAEQSGSSQSMLSLDL